MPTIKDVARHCGVSIATVSAVINDAEWVPEATRDRVAAAIDELKYRPNRLAQGLKTRRSYAVGVVVSDVTNPFYTDVVRSLSHELRKHELSLVLCDSDHDFDVGGDNFRMLLEKQIDAVVLIGDCVRRDAVDGFVRENPRIPVVAIERDYRIDAISTLLVDSEQGAFEGTSHLIEQGFTRIGMISGPLTGPGSKSYGRLQQYRGFRRALQVGGVEFDGRLVAEGDFRYSGGQSAMRRLLELHSPPEAVFAANDMMALGALDVARNDGILVPDHVAIIGYDDIPIAAHTSPPLTTMAIPKQELGVAAAKAVVRRLGKERASTPERRIFSAKLVVRRSARFRLNKRLERAS